MESCANASGNLLGGRDRSFNARANDCYERSPAEKAVRPRPGDHRSIPADDLSGRCRRSRRRQKQYWQLPPRSARALRLMERGTTLSSQSRECPPMSAVLTRAEKPTAALSDTRLVKDCLAGSEAAWSLL